MDDILKAIVEGKSQSKVEMNVTNYCTADPEQIASFFTATDDGPYCMVNLLKFKKKATYADGSEPELSGEEAYMRYAIGVQPHLEAIGGKIRFSGRVTELMIGKSDELWDVIAIAEFPSRAQMMKMIQSPGFQAQTKHRDAGLAGQLNIRTKEAGK